MILVHPAIDPVIFSLGFVKIRWYGLAYVAAFLIAIYLIKLFNKKLHTTLNTKLIDEFFIWSIFGVIIGGRVGYVLFYQLENFLINPIYLIYIWKGGMSFHGGLIGIIICMLIFSKKNKTLFFELSDLVSLVAPIGLFFGRIANFINVELVGRITEFPFSIIYPTIDNLPRHPSQLYEAFFEGIILFAILFFIFKKNYSINQYGKLSGLFLFFYGIFRFLIEFLREPDEHIGLFFNFLSIGQILCLPLVFIGLVILLKKKLYV